MPAKRCCDTKNGAARTPPCPPLKGQSQDWQQDHGIRETPLVPTGTVADQGLNKSMYDDFVSKFGNIDSPLNDADKRSIARTLVVDQLWLRYF